MERIIFRNRQTYHIMIYMVILCLVFGGVIAWAGDGKDLLLVMAYTLGMATLLVVLYSLGMLYAGRTLIAEIILKGDKLQIEMVNLFGKGRQFELPLPPASDWGWYSQKADSKSNQRVGIMTLMVGGTKYSMSLQYAEIVDEVELRKLAPTVVDEMTASNVLLHKPATA